MLPYTQITTIDLIFFKLNIWGIIAAIAFIVAFYLVLREFKKRNMNKKHAYDLFFYILIGSIIGSRLFHVIQFWGDYSHDLIKIFRLWDGGVAFFGGFILAVLFSYIYIRKNKLNFLNTANLFAPFIALGYAIARIGCFLIGDHLGRVTNLPWAIYYGEALRHPVSLYHIIAGVIIFLITYKLKRIAFILLLLSYSITRFIIDFFRIDPLYYGLTATQYICIILFFISVILLIKLKK